MYSLNYDIDYSEINYNPVGLQGNLAQYNGINAIAFGFPYLYYIHQICYP